MNNNYKETPIGILPKDWELSPIGDIAKTTSGGTPSRERPEYYNGNIPWVKSGELNDSIITQTSEQINEDAISNSNAKLFPKGTLLVAMYGATAGKVGILGIDATTNQAVCAVFPNERVSPRYLFYALMHRRRDLLGERYGGAQPNISQRVLRSFQVPLPPLQEQRTIAHMLTSVHQTIEATERVIEAARELKRSMMKYLFTYGPVPIDQADRVTLKDTDIGEVPEAWDIAKLGDNSSKPQYGYTESATTQEVGPRFLRITDIQDDGSVDWTKVPYCNCSGNAFEKYKLEKGDILVARIGATTGKSCLISECPPAVFASYLIRIRTEAASLSPSYMYQFMTSTLYLAQINMIKHGRLKQGINIPNLQNLSFPLPQLSEQEQIVSILDTVDTKIRREIQSKSALECLFVSLLHHLMTGKIRVQV